MKQLLFTLSIGISAFTLAADKNEIINFDNTSNNKIITETCFEQTVIIFENQCGEFIGTDSSPITFVPCAEGQPEGSTTTYYWRHVRNTDTGTGCTE